MIALKMMFQVLSCVAFIFAGGYIFVKVTANIKSLWLKILVYILGMTIISCGFMICTL